MRIEDDAEKPTAYPVRPQAAIRPLITAEEAYPALERVVVEARHSIWLAYRVFEPWTVLVSDAGRDVAGDWIGLLRAKLSEGVQVRVLLSDFDALGGTELHERSWRCLRALSPLWERGDFAALPALHMAGAGWLWRLLLWPVGAWRMHRLARALNRQPLEERRRKLAVMPGLWPVLTLNPDGRIGMRIWRLPGLYPATYHQKFAVIDRQFAMVGGLDLNNRRYDDLMHHRPTCQTWADVAVTTEGPIATDLARHFAECWAREAPRQLRRTERMVRTAPRGLMLPPMPTPEQAPALPDERADESADETRRSLAAATRSPVTVGTDPDDAPPPRQLAGEVSARPPPNGGPRVATDPGAAKGEAIARGSPLGRVARPGPGNIRHPAPEAAEGGAGTAQVVRTVTGQPRGRGLLRLAPRTMTNEIERAHLELVGAAQRLIYLETQFLRSRGVVDALVRAGRRSRRLGLIVVIPAAPMEIAFDGRGNFADRFGEHLQARAVRRIRRAFGTRAVIVAPLRPVPHRPDHTGTTERAGAHGAEMIFVHSKVMTVDDRAAIVGSANMNGRSLHWDVELALRFEDGAGPARLRRRLFAHWLPPDAPEAAFDLDSAVDVWRSIALDEITRPPAQRTSFIAPYAVGRARRFGRPVPGVPEDVL